MHLRKDVVELTVPILTEQIFVISMGVINTMMSGHIGNDAVSAIGMVDSINNIFISFFSALAIGGTVVVAQYIGQNNIKMANETAKQALFASLLISFAVTILIWIMRQPLVAFLYGSAEKSVLSNAFMYLGITLLTYPLITAQLISSGVLRGAGDTKTPMKITIIMNVLNIILSYVLIYGLNINNSLFHIYFRGLKVEGAAIGIAIARTVGAVLILIVLLRGSKIIKLTRLFKYKPNKHILTSIFNIGIPASVESLLFNGGKLITQIYIVNLGTISIASNYITGSITSILNIPGSALSIAITTLVGQNMGRNDINEARQSMLYLTKLSTIALGIFGLVSIPIAHFLVCLYTSSAPVIELSTKLLKYNALWMPVWSIAFVLPGGLKGAGDAKYTMITSIIGMWAFRITMGYVFGIILHFGLLGVWTGMYLDWVVRGILYVLRLKNGKWMQHQVI